MKDIGYREFKNGILLDNTFTIDAMNTQRVILEKLHKRGTDYVLPVKENQINLREEIMDFFVHKAKIADVMLNSTYREIDAGHDRIKERKYCQLGVSELITEASKWAAIKTVIEVYQKQELAIGSDVPSLNYWLRTSLNY